MNKQLKEAVGIATYNRPHDLMECLKYLNCQTRIPHEIVIADASANYDEMNLLIRNQLANLLSKTHLKYLKSPIGTTLQRNLIIDTLESDIVIFLDDDTRASPDYIEKIMEVFEKDIDAIVGGVEGTALEGGNIPNFEQGQWTKLNTPSKKSGVSFANFSMRYYLKQIENFVAGPFVPLSMLKPIDLEIKEPLKSLPLIPMRTLYGCNMSFRSELVKKNRFNENFKRYSFLEDFEASYRIGYNHLLLKRKDAFIVHLLAQSGRLEPSLVSYLYLINLAFIAKTILPWSKDLAEYQINHAKKRMWFEFCLGFFRRTGFSHYRATKEGLRQTIEILEASSENVEKVYHKAQEEGFDKGKF